MTGNKYILGNNNCIKIDSHIANYIINDSYIAKCFKTMTVFIMTF